MIGRGEIEEILGMVAIISLLLATGIAVQSLEERTQLALAASVPVQVPDPVVQVPDFASDAVRLEVPVLRTQTAPPLPAVVPDTPDTEAVTICTCGEEAAAPAAGSATAG